MAIRTEIFAVSKYDRIHWMHCTLDGVEKYEPSGHDILGNENSAGADGYWTGTPTCRACNVAKNIVTVEGVEYNNYPGGRIEHRPSRYLNAAGERYEQVFSITHEGLTIASRERNYADDSDFYALVWNPETLRVEEHSVGTTRFGGTDDNSASVDLAEEHVPAYREYLISEQARALQAADVANWSRAIHAAVRPESKGQTVKVVRGRKTPIGTVGQIIWTGEDNYGNDRIGLRTAEGETHFTAASNVEVIVDSDDLPRECEYVRSDSEYRQAAEAAVARVGFRGLIARTAPAGIHAVA